MNDIVNDTTGLKLIDPLTGLSVEEKILKVALQLKNVDIFYYSIYIQLNRVYVTNNAIVSTLGVNLNTLFINTNFIQKISEEDLLFTVIHELYHITLNHPYRGINTVYQFLYNIACDLYINKMISDTHLNFGTTLKKEELQKNKINVANKENYSFNNKIYMKLPKTTLYSDKIDIDKDNVDDLYLELVGECEKQQNNSNCQNKQQQSSSNNQDKQQQNNSNFSAMNIFGNNNQNKQQQSSPLANQSSFIKFRGEEIEISDIENKDLFFGQGVKNEKIDKNDITVQEINKQILRNARNYAKTIGCDTDSLLRNIVEKVLAPKVNWKRVLKSRLNAFTGKENTYAKPDKRFLYNLLNTNEKGRCAILPGEKPMIYKNLKGVKVCIDTSGSISDTELNQAFSQMLQLFKIYKIEAELIYWDTKVQTTGLFSTPAEMLKIRPKGYGGTDVKCIFDYFADKKRCKIPPSLILVFTDGYFVNNFYEYKRKYGRNTIWILSGVYSDVIKFKKTINNDFGVIAEFKTEKQEE